jgi:L-aminopeptidase/D-esterase-like protein
VTLPAGFSVGHWTDLEGATGCTVVLPPHAAIASGEVRGGAPGTRESDLLSPSAAVQEVHAVLLSGGSAFGLAAADGVMRWLEERGRGFELELGMVVPLVPSAVVFDLPLGDPTARPDASAGAAACDAASATVERGTVGVGTGCTVGKLRGPDGWTKGGVGLASEEVEGARISALAAVNALGDVLAEDGSVLAGVRGDASTADLLRAGELPPFAGREATTLVTVMTDARLTKLDAWLLARAANAGIARAVDPAHTAVDGDAAFVLASGDHEVDPFILQGVVPHVVGAAIRDAVTSATSLHGCPAGPDRSLAT